MKAIDPHDVAHARCVLVAFDAAVKRLPRTRLADFQALLVVFYFTHLQTLCFAAGANSIFYGDKLLTTGNPDVQADRELLDKLGMTTS